MPLSRGTFAPATATQAGGVGFVPSPAVGDQGKYLQGDGTFGGPLFNKLQVPSDRYIGPLVAYGSAGSTKTLVSFYVYFVPVYSNASRSISEIVFEVTTASGATGTPTMEIALYNCSGTSGLPTTQVTNSLKTGISPTSTGVKTSTYSPAFTMPAGISFVGIKVKPTVSNNATVVRSMDGTGRESAFFSSIGNGWPTNPTSNNYASTVPYISAGDNVGLASDYTSASFTYAVYGENFVAVFLKT
jgi:hypothetical protein